MSTYVPIGEFSRLSHLSVKALRHYHEIALLVPAAVDPTTGYRRYATDQVRTAQLISRLRSLRMPLPEISSVLVAADTGERDELLQRHLQRMESELARTRQVVTSLRQLLGPETQLTFEVRDLPATEVLAISATVARVDVSDHCGAAFPVLARTLATAGIEPDGPMGGTYDEEFFTQDRGRVVTYVPLPAGVEPPAVADRRLRPTVLPAGRFVTVLHPGPYVDFDRSYGALGSHVAEHFTSIPGPIRERYLIGPGDSPDEADYRTEICWPIADH